MNKCQTEACDFATAANTELKATIDKAKERNREMDEAVAKAVREAFPVTHPLIKIRDEARTIHYEALKAYHTGWRESFNTYVADNGGAEWKGWQE